MQSIFSQGPSASARMIVLVLASLALMTVDHRWHQLEVVRSTLSTLLYPLQYTIDLPIRFYYWGEEIFSTRQTLLTKNREYETRYLENRIQLQKLNILQRENTRLRQLLGATPETAERLLIAEIVKVGVDPNRQLIVLNKGTHNGVYVGLPVIDAQGVMGQVIHVGPLSSTAILITDISHAIPVQVDRNGLRAIAYGSGNINELEVRNLPHNTDIRVGDTLITSGLGNHFPANYPVATVTSVKHLPGELFSRISAKPLALLDQGREVLLLWNNKADTPLVAGESTETDKQAKTVAPAAKREPKPATDKLHGKQKQ